MCPVCSTPKPTGFPSWAAWHLAQHKSIPVHLGRWTSWASAMPGSTESHSADLLLGLKVLQCLVLSSGSICGFFHCSDPGAKASVSLGPFDGTPQMASCLMTCEKSVQRVTIPAWIPNAMKWLTSYLPVPSPGHHTLIVKAILTACWADCSGSVQHLDSNGGAPHDLLPCTMGLTWD